MSRWVCYPESRRFFYLFLETVMGRAAKRKKTPEHQVEMGRRRRLRKWKSQQINRLRNKAKAAGIPLPANVAFVQTEESPK